MNGTILIDKPESILFLISNIQEAFGRLKIYAKLLYRASRDSMSSAVFH
jgi:hypothetical protein